MKPQPYIYYFAYNAELRPDGVLRVTTAGSDANSLWDGFYDVTPDNPDYEFWLWLKQREKPRWYQFRAGRGLDEQAILKYREEYNRECA